MDHVDLTPYLGKEEAQRLLTLALGVRSVMQGPLDAEKAELICISLADLELRAGELYLSIRERLQIHNRAKEN